VLYAGRLLEVGNTCDVFTAPHHPYTELLIRSVPVMRRGWLDETTRSRVISNAVQSTTQLRDDLCVFRNRCPFMIGGTCDREPPPRRTLGDSHELLCHLDEQTIKNVMPQSPERQHLDATSDDLG
jgi:peptide/nickel transport system ATP-binding protein